VPLNAHAGASVAELVATGNRPCVIDLGGWMVGERTRFFIDFASTLFRTTTAPLRLVIDEVHNFAPQQKFEKNPDAMKMLHWSNRLASEGAGKGIVILSASQRPQKVHKDFLTCAETLVAMRVIHPLDRGAIKEWIDGCPDAAKGKEVLTSLASMARGEGWVWSPEVCFGPKRVKFPMFATYDSFAAPTGQTAKPLKGWASVDLEDVKAKLVAVVEEAKANDPKELKRQIGELQKQLNAKPKTENNATVIDKAVADAVAARDREWAKSIKERDGLIDSLKVRMAKAATMLHVNGEATPQTGVPAASKPVVTPIVSRSVVKRVASQTRPNQAASELGLTRKQQQIINAVAWYESLGNPNPTNIQVGAVALIDATGGHFSNTVGPLSSAGLLARESGCLTLTDAGRQLAEPMSEATTLADYHDVLRNRVRQMKSASGKTVEMLNVIIGGDGEQLTAEQIGEAVGIDHTGGHFSNTIGPLGTVGLIRRNRGVIVPTEVLFPKGL
jgi:hypothetical protein